LANKDFGVLTADPELNSLGCGEPSSARVLFTTHSMVERLCWGRSFTEVSALHYRGRVRQVRIWDEAILPGQALTISRDSLGFLFAPLRASHPALADGIEDLFTKLKTIGSGTIIKLPNLGAEQGV